MRGGRPFQNWSICMGYPSWTLLFLRRQNHRSCGAGGQEQVALGAAVSSVLNEDSTLTRPRFEKKSSQRGKEGTGEAHWRPPGAPGRHPRLEALFRILCTLTLKTNISRRKNATVLKLPSQMFGLPFPGSAGRSAGGRGGRECRSCLRSEVECVLRVGRVGNGLVGSIMAVGMPEEDQSIQARRPNLKHS